MFIKNDKNLENLNFRCVEILEGKKCVEDS